jgi:hypothetical protein
MADETMSEGEGQGGPRPHNATRGLVCESCGHPRLKVVYTRRAPGGRIVRRRECKHCGQRITTWEHRIGQVHMRNDLPTGAISSISSHVIPTPQP